jgi:hypothetical protein
MTRTEFAADLLKKLLCGRDYLGKNATSAFKDIMEAYDRQDSLLRRLELLTRCFAAAHDEDEKVYFFNEIRKINEELNAEVPDAISKIFRNGVL